MKDARNRQNKTEEEVNELTNKLKTLEVSSILEKGLSNQQKCALNLHRILCQIACTIRRWCFCINFSDFDAKLAANSIIICPK